LPQAGASVGDDRGRLRNVNAAWRKPNEDAVSVLRAWSAKVWGGFATRSRANFRLGARSDAKPVPTFA